MSLREYLNEAEKFFETEVHSFEKFIKPLAAHAIGEAKGDLIADAELIAVKVMADPGLTTDGAKREAAIKSLEDQLINQGYAVTAHTATIAVAAVQNALDDRANATISGNVQKVADAPEIEGVKSNSGVDPNAGPSKNPSGGVQ